MRKLWYLGKIMIALTRFAFRLVSGRNLLRERRTNATFMTPATTEPGIGEPALSRWEMQRGLSRLLWRLAGGYLLLLALLSAILSVAESYLTLPLLLRPGYLLLLHLGIAILSVSAWRIRRRMRDYGFSYPILRREERTPEEISKRLLALERRRSLSLALEAGPSRSVAESALDRIRIHLLPTPENVLSEKLRISRARVEGRKVWEQEKVLPVSRAAAIILGHPIPDREASRWITIPKDYREPGSAVEILLPPNFTGADAGVKARLEKSVAAKLGMKEVSARWETQGSSPRVLLSSPPSPPGLVSFSDVEPYLAAQGEWDFFYGLTGSGEAFSISVTGDTPHGAVSSGSGGGKSELLKGKIAQAGHKGWFSVILDWKEESQDWARNQPGVRYIVSVEKIHDACVRLGDEVEYRKANPDSPRPRVQVILEEWSITAPLLTDYWTALRSTAEADERKTMPSRSPAITSIMKVIFAGRALGIFIEMVAIRFSARVTNGNADLRESFQVINMARYKPQTVKMLAPDVKPFPKKSLHPGRWVAVNGEEAIIYQAVLWSDDQARAWHQSGLEIPSSPWSSLCETVHKSTDPTGLNVDTTQGVQLSDRSTALNSGQLAIEGEVVATVDARKLSDMAEALEPLGITYQILRHAAKAPDSGFPGAHGGSQFKGYTYNFAQVKRWARRRYASQKAGK